MSLNRRPIGFFDSGVGGVTVLQETQKLLPHENFLYFADEANYPYGEKSREEVEACSLKAAEWLLEQGAKLLVIACHTASVCALEALQRTCKAPVLGMIQPSLSLIEESRVQSLTLLGSRALVQSQLYQNRIAKELPGVRMRAVEGQELVAVVQEKRQGGQEIAQRVLVGDIGQALFLACTHFSCVRAMLQEVVGDNVLILDPAKKMARVVVDVLEGENWLSSEKTPGTCQFFSSVKVSVNS